MRFRLLEKFKANITTIVTSVKQSIKLRINAQSICTHNNWNICDGNPTRFFEGMNPISYQDYVQ